MPNLSPCMENYLEQILLLRDKNRVVRVKNLVDTLHIKAPSVNKALGTLGRLGLVNHERYGHVELTSDGERIAKSLYERHNIIKRMLSRILGLKEKTAERDACLIEHYLSGETIKRMLDYTLKIEGHNR